MPEFTFLVGISSEGENREAAELALQGVLVPLLKSRDSSSPIDCWWIAEDERHDGSDLDSAVFVPPGRQAEAQLLLARAGGFACAECGTTEASTYVVTTLDPEDVRGTRTEVCRSCDDALRAAQLDAEPEGPRPPRDLDWSDVEADAARMMEEASPWVVETTYNTGPQGEPAEEWDDSNRTLHGPFSTEAAAQHFMDEVWPDGDTDVREQVAFQLNSPGSLQGS